jgi:serpin B
MYDAKVSHINFSSPDAKNIINNWCAEKTNNTIKNASSSFTNNISFALINALYFKGIWKKQLSEDEKDVIRWYCADGYSDINSYLRKYGDWEYINKDTLKKQCVLQC